MTKLVFTYLGIIIIIFRAQNILRKYIARRSIHHHPQTIIKQHPGSMSNPTTLVKIICTYTLTPFSMFTHLLSLSSLVFWKKNIRKQLLLFILINFIVRKRRC
uniref:Uncharacterized protein n=1 Tax=Cacopsylla melanoneura TaxID=428564 RepID=A0A8D8VQ44_9HEMI